MAKDTRADALHDTMYHSPFARRIAAFEHHYDLGTAGFYPFLHFHQLSLEFAQFSLVFLALELVSFLKGLFPILLFRYWRSKLDYHYIGEIHRLLRCF